MPVAYKKNGIPPTDDSKYCLEASRLESFDDGWIHPDDSYCSRENMAKAGLFYTGYDDVVKCFTCHKKMQGWDPTNDDPWLKHKEISPKCTFAKLGKEQRSLTVEEWIDVMCSRAVNSIDQTFAKFEQLLNQD